MFLGFLKSLVFLPMKNYHVYFITCMNVLGLLEKSSLPSDEKSSCLFYNCMNVFGLLEKSSLPSDEKSSFLFYNLYGCFWVARKVKSSFKPKIIIFIL